jgi:hypothetical protein
VPLLAGRPREGRERLPADDQLDRDREVHPSLPLALALGRFFNVPIDEMFDADD